MTNWARIERAGLVDALVARGPDAPTLCAGWTTRDLAAHLVLRERRPDAAAGIVLPPLAGYSASVRDRLLARPWPELVDQVRTGPPKWSPFAIDAVDSLVNTVEFFVHHEDIRRAQPGWEPRRLDPDLYRTLWRRLLTSARLLVRRSPVGLVLRDPEGQEIHAKRATPEVTVQGAPSELVLFAYGRQDHARVEIIAPDDVAAKVREARFGL